MCGRYATSRSSADLSALFDAFDEGGGLSPDYNLAPTDPGPIVRMSERLGGRVLSVARWGLVPAWAKDTGGAARMINARAETVATARAYAPSFAKRRCLVPADGWYEWRKLDAKRRQPYFMTPRDGSGLSFAGLWSSWGRGADRMLTYTVITTTAVDEFGLVHDRMPLLMTPDRWQPWLAADPADAKAMLTGADAGWLSGLEIRPVGPGVGDVRNDGPALTARVAAPPLGSMEPDTSDLTLFEA